MKSAYMAVCIVALLSSGCRRNYPEEKSTGPVEKDHLVDANRAVVQGEAKAIEKFVETHGWKMQKTGTGLRYDIYQSGNGKKADASSVLSIAYKVFLLDGTLCYEADERHPQQLVTGKGQQVNGLEEGLLLMDEGARARFVVPNHLAYGITGDQDKIPPASALYYDVHLLKSEKPTNGQ
jgi:FKBP-type peptidyl-prolyl cis-trans isomerase FkpA